MKIDLHCHTKKTKVGDPPTRNVTTELFARKVEQAKVGILAITNHNAFDYEQYCSLRDSVHEFCQVYPGIELDVQGENNKGHIIIISNPNNVESFLSVITQFITKSPDAFVTTLEEITKVFSELDVLYIPHCFHKESSLSEQDIEQLNHLVKEQFRVIHETTYRSLGVYNNFGYSVIAGSDVKNWEIYETYSLPELRLPVATYSQLIMLLKRTPSLITSLLSYKSIQSIRVSPHKGVYFNLKIFQDFNVLFGQKGTGKTEILKSLYHYYRTQSIQCSVYFGAEKDEAYSEFEKTNDIVPSVDEFGIDDCSGEIKLLRDWTEQSPCLFREYIDHRRTEKASASKKRLLVSKTTLLPNFNFNQQNITDYKSLITAISTINKYIAHNSLLTESEKTQLSELLDLVEKKAHELCISKWIEFEAAKLTNGFIRGIQRYADKCTDTKTRPRGTGFEGFASSRFALYSAANQIFNHLLVPEVTISDEFHGSIEGKGKLRLQVKLRFLCEASDKIEFNNTKTKFTEALRYIKAITKSFAQPNVGEVVQSLSNLLIEYDIFSIVPFIGVRKEAILEDGTVYKPSSGEKGIILLQRRLRTDADVYILDEPEAGMGNSYIKSSIIPVLMSLVSEGKTVIIATHNANIAVLTLPYNSVFREHYNGQYRTYTGNPFVDQLVNINDENDIKCWTSESIHTLEGGEEAFYGRKNIYESSSERN